MKLQFYHLHLYSSFELQRSSGSFFKSWWRQLWNKVRVLYFLDVNQMVLKGTAYHNQIAFKEAQELNNQKERGIIQKENEYRDSDTVDCQEEADREDLQ